MCLGKQAAPRPAVLVARLALADRGGACFLGSSRPRDSTPGFLRLLLQLVLVHPVQLLKFLLEGLGLLVVGGGPADRLVHLCGHQESEDQLVVAKEAHGDALEEDGPEFLLQLGSSEPCAWLSRLPLSKSQALGEEVAEPSHGEAVHRVEGR